jgi:glycosyltransferase involved in cell wall biosynthesis
MQKRKIVYIGNKGSYSGATTTYIETLSSLLHQEGYTVISSSSKKNKTLRMLAMIGTVLRHRKTASKVLIDTYSTQNFYYAVVIGILCRWLQLPYIPILHGGNLPARLDKSPKLSKRLFGAAEINVAPSHYLYEAFLKKGYDNIRLIPNVISIADFPFTLRKETKLHLLWVRSFSEIYNPALALKVVENLLVQGYDATLCMVGPEKDGSLARCKEMASKKNLPVIFSGLLTKSEWITLSKDYDIFINTTNFDNTPVSIIEAMALGLPIVSTNVGGLPFLIEDSVDGILVPPENADFFVAALLQLYNKPEKTMMLSQTARKKAERFDWETIKQSWISLLDS